MEISSGESVLSDDSRPDEECEDLGLSFNKDTFDKGDYVLVNLSSKKTSKYFVAEIHEIHEGDYLKIQFLKRKAKSSTFIKEDNKIYDAAVEDVVAKLPRPKEAGGSLRLKGCLIFQVNLSNYNIE